MTDKISRTVKIIKELSDARTAEYILYISTSEGETLCSIAVIIQDEKAVAHDICRDTKRAEDFLYLLALEEVEPCHLLDIVYDTLPL